jgi:formate hydrogenlyase subunit 3/multisubunit Na+/H+ antiporter MnhD subunit
MTPREESLEDTLRIRIIRLNATIVGFVLGIVAGLIVFIATNWLVLKGGPIGPEGQPIVGPHLSLLSQFFIGYRVSPMGSLVGFAYAFVSGFVGGYSIAYVYDWLVIFRDQRLHGQE